MYVYQVQYCTLYAQSRLCPATPQHNEGWGTGKLASRWLREVLYVRRGRRPPRRGERALHESRKAHPITGDTVGIVYCTTHAEKKVRNNLHKSFYSTAKRRLLVPALIEYGETEDAAPAS